MDSRDQRRACVIVNFGDNNENVDISPSGKESHRAEITRPFESTALSSFRYGCHWRRTVRPLS
jgi:hypothetical protein